MRLFSYLILVFLSGCLVQTQSIAPDDTSATTIDDWEFVTDGLENDLIRVDAVLFQATRIDPTYYDFRAHYRPNSPLTIQEWREELPDAHVIINANFFDVDHNVLGLLVSDGNRFGIPYRERGGTFWVSDDGIAISNNREINESPTGATQAIQAFPMLVQDSQPTYNNTNDTAISRRTIIAQDSQGHIILMVTAGFGLSLYDLSQYLPHAGLEIVSALNLDGGGSTMMYIAPSQTTIVSLDPVPAVLAVYPKNPD